MGSIICGCKKEREEISDKNRINDEENSKLISQLLLKLNDIEKNYFSHTGIWPIVQTASSIINIEMQMEKQTAKYEEVRDDKQMDKLTVVYHLNVPLIMKPNFIFTSRV